MEVTKLSLYLTKPHAIKTLRGEKV